MILPIFDAVVTGAGTSPVAQRAQLAYEIATCWHREPQRARALATACMKDALL